MKFFCFCWITVVLVLPGCDSAQKGEPPAEVNIFVSIAPQKYLVEKIIGNSGKVQVLVPPGREPHDYSPSAKQISDLGKADVLFTIGVPFEETLIPKIREMFPNLKIVDITKGIWGLSLKNGCSGCGHEHAHNHSYDPHVWMSPHNMNLMGKNVTKQLSILKPAKAEEYQAANKKLSDELTQLTKKIFKELQPYHGRTFYIFHPTMGYFANDFGLKQKAIEVDGKEPTAKQLGELIAQARKENVHVIFVQPQFPKRAAQSIAEAIDGSVHTIDPLAEDYIKNLEKITAALCSAFEGK